MKPKKIYYSEPVDITDFEGNIIKIKKGEKFVSFVNFKRKLFFMTTKGIYQLKEVTK